MGRGEAKLQVEQSIYASFQFTDVFNIVFVSPDQ